MSPLAVPWRAGLCTRLAMTTNLSRAIGFSFQRSPAGGNRSAQPDTIIRARPGDANRTDGIRVLCSLACATVVQHVAAGVDRTARGRLIGRSGAWQVADSRLRQALGMLVAGDATSERSEGANGLTTLKQPRSTPVPERELPANLEQIRSVADRHGRGLAIRPMLI